MRNYYRKAYTRAGYRRKKHFHAGRFFAAIGIVLLVLAALFAGWKIVKKCSEIKFDESIWGSGYEEQLLSLPSPSPTPTPRANGRTSKFPAEYVQAYNGYEGEKTAYLTFDDGPTANVTPKILDILKEKDVKATFFTLGKMVEAYPEMAKRAVSEGHILANHSYGHDYKAIYASPDSLIAEIKKAEDVIVNTVGEEGYTRVFRFPGGSFEKKAELKNALLDIDYVYVDWNALNGDAEGQNVSVERQMANLQKTTKGMNCVVILMHDAATKQTTAEALPQMIDYLKEQGFTFRTLKRE